MHTQHAFSYMAYTNIAGTCAGILIQFVYSVLVKMSANLQWQCIRKSSCFVLQKNGVTFNTVSVISSIGYDGYL